MVNWEDRKSWQRKRKSSSQYQGVLFQNSVTLSQILSQHAPYRGPEVVKYSLIENFSIPVGPTPEKGEQCFGAVLPSCPLLLLKAQGKGNKTGVGRGSWSI